MLLLRPPGDISRVVPMGLLSLATHLKARHPGVDVRIVDLRLTGGPGSPDHDRELGRALAAPGPDLVGISAMSMEIEETRDLARLVRRRRPDVRLVAGGPLASCESSILDRLGLFDHIVVGEGEEVLCAVVAGEVDPDAAVLRDGDFDPVDVDLVPFPDYRLVDVRRYFRGDSHEAFQRHRRYAPVFTSRGCPYACGFCANVFGRKVRFRRLEHVIAEIRHLVDTYGVEELHIEDDVFNIDRRRVRAFFSALQAEGLALAISFPNGLTYRTLDRPMITQMKRGGVYRVCLGVESASPRILQLINKPHDFPALEGAIDGLADSRILTHGFFMVGFPTETRADLEATCDFIRRSRLHTFRVSRFVPFAGTDLGARFPALLADRGLAAVKGAQYHATDVNHSAIPTAVIDRLVRQTNLRFYLDPRRALATMAAMDRKTLLRNSLRAIEYLATGQVKSLPG